MWQSRRRRCRGARWSLIWRCATLLPASWRQAASHMLRCAARWMAWASRSARHSYGTAVLLSCSA